MIKSFLIFTILLLQVSLGWALEDVVTVEKSEVLSSIVETAAVAKTEDQIPLNIDHVKATSETSATPTRLMMTGVILATLLTAAYYFVRKYKVSNVINKSNMQIKVLSQHYLGPKKSLAIIRVAGESILVGVTDTNISMIKSLALIDDEVPSEMPQNFTDAMQNQKKSAVKQASADAGMSSIDQDELDEEFSFSGLKDSVAKKLKSMRSI